MKQRFSIKVLNSKLMYKFLKKRGALQIYCQNAMAFRKPTIEVKTKEDIIRLIGTNNNSINFSFVWKGTPQGHNYWQTLDSDFYTYLQEWHKALRTIGYYG